MKPWRRLAAAVVLGVLALGGVAACQSNPAVAAYVDDTTISQERVEEVTTELRATFEQELADELAGVEGELNSDELAEREATGQQRIGEQVSTMQSRTLEMMVLTEAGNRYAEREQVSIPEPAFEALGEQLGLPADHSLTHVYAEFWAVMTALTRHAEPAPVTEADQREVFAHLTVGGQPVTESFEELQPFLTDEVLGQQVGLRNLLMQVVDEADIRINPAYDLVYQVPVTIGQAESWLGVPISEPSSVVDAS